MACPGLSFPACDWVPFPGCQDNRERRQAVSGASAGTQQPGAVCSRRQQRRHWQGWTLLTSFTPAPCSAQARTPPQFSVQRVLPATCTVGLVSGFVLVYVDASLSETGSSGLKWQTSFVHQDLPGSREPESGHVFLTLSCAHLASVLSVIPMLPRAPPAADHLTRLYPMDPGSSSCGLLRPADQAVLQGST